MKPRIGRQIHVGYKPDPNLVDLWFHYCNRAVLKIARVMCRALSSAWRSLRY